MAPTGLASVRRAAWALAWLAIALAAAPCQAQVRKAVVKYKSGDQKVTLECFVPTTPGRHPTVLLLHGSGGLEQATGPLFREAAAGFAQNGYVALIPHYFDSTKHGIGKPLKTGEYEAMLESLKDAIQYAVAQPEVDADRFAILGLSMGSNLGTLLAVGDPRIKALACWSGAYPPRKPSPKLPPLLIIHGANDTSTPTDLVRKFEEGLKEQKMPHEVQIYRGIGHNFDVARFRDAADRTLTFFDQYIDAPARSQPGDPPQTGAGTKTKAETKTEAAPEGPPREPSQDTPAPTPRRGTTRKSGRQP